MDFVSPGFIGLIICAVFLFNLSARGWWKAMLLTAVNTVFIVSLAGNIRQLLPLAAFVLLGFLLIKAIEKFRVRVVLVLAVSVILSVFVYLKKYSFAGFLPFIERPYVTVGLSFILFRIIHMAIDVYDRDIKDRICFVPYCNYICLFLTFLSGPIWRFQEHSEEINGSTAARLTAKSVEAAFTRIVDGYVKVSILSWILSGCHGYFAARLGTRQPDDVFVVPFLLYTGAALIYTLYLYTSFSGYMDVVIGAGQLMGFRLPENFDHPFGSKDILEFWSRWHITLSEWFKTYVFNPLLKFMVHTRDIPGLRTYYGVLAYFVTFLLMGIWHGSTLVFLAYGIYLGAGVSCNKLFDIELRKRLGKERYERISGKYAFRLLGAALTYSYFSIGLTCLWADSGKVETIIGSIGPAGVFCVFIMGAIVCLVVSTVTLLAVRAMKNAAVRARAITENIYYRQAVLAFKVFILVSFVAMKIGTVPEFIYKAF